MDLRKEEAIFEYRFDLATEKGKKIGREEGKEKGIKIGEEKGKIEVAKAILTDNVDIDTIAKFTGFFVSKVEELRSMFQVEEK